MKSAYEICQKNNYRSKAMTVYKQGTKRTAYAPHAFLLLATMSFLVQAESTRQSGWRYGAEVYFWDVSIGDTATNGGDIDIGKGKLLDDLEMAFMGMAFLSISRRCSCGRMWKMS